MKCPACNRENEENAIFCMYCGNKIRTDDVFKLGKMYCSQCGNLISSDSHFCSYCGSKVTPISQVYDDFLEIANHNYTQKEYYGAIEYYKKELERDSSSQDAKLGLANSYYRIKDYSNFLKYYNKLSNINKNSEDQLYHKLDAEQSLENYDDALITLNKLIDSSGGDVILYEEKIDLLKKLNRQEDIIDVYDNILEINPQSHEVYFKKSKLSYSLERYEDAFNAIENALEINSSDSYLDFKRKILEKYNPNDDNYSHYPSDESFLKSKEFYMLGRNQDALNCMEDVEESVDSLVLKARIYFAMADYENSIENYTKASEIDKTYLKELIFTYAVAGDFKSARKYYADYQNKNDALDFLTNPSDSSKYFELNDYKEDLLIFPYICYLKIKEDINLSYKYLSLFRQFISENGLIKGYVNSNFHYFLNLYDCLINLADVNVNEFNNHSISNYRTIMEFMELFYDVENINNSVKLGLIYKSIAKIRLFYDSDDALEYFKLALRYDNSDGEVWLYVGDLSKDRICYNKALFCFDKTLEVEERDEVMNFKGIALYLLGCKKNSIDFFKQYLDRDFTEYELKQYILNYKLSGV